MLTLFRSLGLLTACLMSMGGAAHAELDFASPFSDHMVLQRELPVPVWGTADPGAEVEVTFASQSHSATSDSEGRWRVTLDALRGSLEPAELSVRSGKDSITRSDVVVGEVWICSGQSNMQFGRNSVPKLKGLSEEGIRTLAGVVLGPVHAPVPARQKVGGWLEDFANRADDGADVVLADIEVGD